MLSTKSSYGCVQCFDAPLQNNAPDSDRFYTSSWLVDDEIDPATSKERQQRANIEQQRKRRLAKQQRRKRRKRKRTLKNKHSSSRAFTLSRPYATQEEMVQAIRQLEAGTKRTQRQPPVTPLPLSHRLNSLQKRGLTENVRRVLLKVKQRLQKGKSPHAVLATLNIQLSNPRFRFIKQIPLAHAALQHELKALRKRNNPKSSAYDSFFEDGVNAQDGFDELAMESLTDLASPPLVSHPKQQLMAVHRYINQAIHHINNQPVVFPKKGYVDAVEKAEKIVQQLRIYINSLRISPKIEHRRDWPRTLNLLNEIQRYLRIARSLGVYPQADIQSALIAARRASFGLLKGSIFFRS